MLWSETFENLILRPSPESMKKTVGSKVDNESGANERHDVNRKLWHSDIHDSDGAVWVSFSRWSTARGGEYKASRIGSRGGGKEGRGKTWMVSNNQLSMHLTSSAPKTNRENKCWTVAWTTTC